MDEAPGAYNAVIQNPCNKERPSSQHPAKNQTEEPA